MTRRAAIVAPVRTGVGKFLGALQAVPVETLAAEVVKAVVARSGVDPARIDDVVLELDLQRLDFLLEFDQGFFKLQWSQFHLRAWVRVEKR